MDGTGLELLLEIKIEGMCHFVSVDSGASLSVIEQGISSFELKPTLTAAKGITGNKLKTTRIQFFTFRVKARP
jgi:hypothetical protein